MKEQLLPFGILKAFNLVMDKITGNSKVRSMLKAEEHVSVLLLLGPLCADSICHGPFIHELRGATMKRLLLGHGVCRVYSCTLLQ